MKATSGHTNTQRGRRVSILLVSGEWITGKFIERLRCKDIMLTVDGERRRVPRDHVARFVTGCQRAK